VSSKTGQLHSAVLRGQAARDDVTMSEWFQKGQYVELCPTIPSSRAGSIPGGTRGIVQTVDPTRPNGDSYLIGFLENERLTGEMAWLREIDLFPGLDQPRTHRPPRTKLPPLPARPRQQSGSPSRTCEHPPMRTLHLSGSGSDALTIPSDEEPEPVSWRVELQAEGSERRHRHRP
jgi:hypothetical protein